ncbi:serine/threonine-protein kinase PLK4-like isoform X2 [Lineus longissimus]|uniref:serine/threonine-protein kinase PLK4-like isoform X2 n=1 Tax=Lineus longissimus TaxID=88925 RepID=UPI002B4D6B77
MWLELGECIEDFEVHELLGKGGFACVYRARSIRTGQEVAIKMIDKKLMRAANMVERVKKEVEIHSRLKHPSILELYSYFEDANYVYLVLELCHNGELYRYLKTYKTTFSEDKARHFLNQIVQGMLYLHSHRILHRDLTLANLLLTKDNEIKIADFGLATQLEVPDEQHFTMCGTPNYISPEIALRNAHGLEADVWSLGCMLYTFLVGKPPFDTHAVKSTLTKVISASYDIPSTMSPDAVHLIANLLKKNPKERLSLVAVMEHPFMSKKDNNHNTYPQKLRDESVDSGHDTMATIASRNSRIRPQKTAENDLAPVKESKQVSSHSCSSEDRPVSRRRYSQSPPVRDSMDQSVSSQHSRHGSRHTSSGSSVFRSGVGSGMECSTSGLSHNHSQHCTRKHSINRSHSSRTLDERDLYHKRSRVNSQNDWVLKDFNPASYEDGHKSSCDNLSHPFKGRSHSACSCQRSASLHTSRTASEEGRLFSSHSEGQRSRLSRQDRARHSCHSDRKPSAGSYHFRESSHDSNTNTNSSRLSRSDSDNLLSRNLSRERLQSDKSIGNVSTASSHHSRHEHSINKSSLSMNKSVHSSQEKIVESKKLIDVVPKLSSARLRPVNQKTRIALVYILEDGEVCLEFLDTKSSQEKIKEIVRITPDGDKISIFQPKTKSKKASKDQANSTLEFTYDTLPEKYWKKYQYAHRFVNLVRSSTPKVTVYTERAKCMLMENTPNADFEVAFHDGAKFKRMNEETKMIQKDGTTLTLQNNGSTQHLSPESQELLEYVEQCHDHCLELESCVSSLDTRPGQPCFPLLIGRGPKKGGKPIMTSPKPVIKVHEDDLPNSVSPPKVKHINQMSAPSSPSDDIAHIKAMNAAAEKKQRILDQENIIPDLESKVSRQPVKTSPRPGILRNVFVQGIGWASQYSNGEVLVQFNDGTQLSVVTVDSSFTSITYTDSNGTASRYSNSDILPVIVKEKLGRLPNVITKLTAQNQPTESANKIRMMMR